MDAGRRSFLLGRRVGKPRPLRPPWALAEAEFLTLCTRCNACLDSCPTRILVSGEGGFPRVDFAIGECSFCGECATSCKDGALQRRPKESPWLAKAVVGKDCLAHQGVVCRSCLEACTPAALRFVPRLGAAAQPEVLAERCSGCGACVGVCPARAVAVTWGELA